MKRFLSAMMAIGLFVSVSVAEDPKPDVKALEKVLAEKAIALKLPGAMIGITRGQQPPIEIAVGFADVEAKTILTSRHHFRIGSVSKVFVATALLTLIDEGKVSADDTIDQYVKEVPNGEKITLRHLATHRSGLYNPTDSRTVMAAFADDPRKEWNEKTILEFSFANKPYFKPGKKYRYSNVNTILLSQVIAKVTGKPWPAAVTARVIQPLGLTETSIPTDNKLPKPFACGYCLGDTNGPFWHQGNKLYDVTTTSPSWWAASANIISTVHDLGKAMKPLATGALLKEKGKKELFAWTKTDDDESEYGFHLERTNGMIGHDGDIPGYQTFAFYLPNEDATVVGIGTMFGWSVDNMPMNDLANEAIQRVFPKRKKQIPKEKE
ncbi:MAG: serine hydrolase domain-containing protein [Gemmataceae bacterium]